MFLKRSNVINHFRDTRAVYCAASIATMLKFDDRELFENSEKYLQSCQSWDGGFGPGESFCLWFVVEKDLNLKYQPGFVFVRRFCFRDEIFLFSSDPNSDLDSSLFCLVTCLELDLTKHSNFLCIIFYVQGPGSESHGGYTYTSVAALTLINKTNEIRIVRTFINLLRYYYNYTIELIFASSQKWIKNEENVLARNIIELDKEI